MQANIVRNKPKYLPMKRILDKHLQPTNECTKHKQTGNDSDAAGGEADASNLKERDPLFEEAARWIVQCDTITTSALQRRYEIGYNRAGHILDQMEAAGIVGPTSGGMPRKVLVTPLDIDQLFV